MTEVILYVTCLGLTSLLEVFGCVFEQEVLGKYVCACSSKGVSKKKGAKKRDQKRKGGKQRKREKRGFSFESVFSYTRALETHKSTPTRSKKKKDNLVLVLVFRTITDTPKGGRVKAKKEGGEGEGGIRKRWRLVKVHSR